ncbi:MarR family winged helix-turn-helix transcriptional regulator [Mesobacterium pallidum]|uniref:MarR family winged helix-turn-helix transcriptional regulator n=1 Tax=Mesobacterium pallidum TaxID=2872037 RepID=UPI001EE32D47|nr:MarR family transcriptional regulator [Mesobacterium pallidum]
MPQRDQEMRGFLSRVGIDSDAIESALAIDAVIQRWRRRYTKRELGAAAIRELGLGDLIDLAQLDVLIAIWAPANEYGDEDGQETMVATIAARLMIDPSRASRLVTELIGKDLVLRQVSQQDARRSVISLTPRGQAIVEAARRYKFLVMGDFLTGWSQEDRDRFLPLLEAFSTWTDKTSSKGAERFRAEVDKIRSDMQGSV